MSWRVARRLRAPTTITLEFAHTRGRLVVMGTAPNEKPPALNALSRSILDAVVDEHDITTAEGTTRFVLVKQRPAPGS